MKGYQLIVHYLELTLFKVLIKSDKFSDTLQKEYGHKCYVRGYGQGHIPNYGHLYTISHGGTELERTYDEPCIGDDLPRSRSWLCCPGSQTTADTQPPPLLSPTTVSSSEVLPPAEPVTRPPAVHVCTNGCVRNIYLLFLVLICSIHCTVKDPLGHLLTFRVLRISRDN